MPIELPSHRAPRETAAPQEEIASLSLEAKIDQFHLEEEREEQEDSVIKFLDSKGELDRVSSVCTFGLVVACIDDSLEDEEEEMALSRKRGLRDLLADRGKGPTPEDALGSQPLLALPTPLLLLQLSCSPFLTWRRKGRRRR